MFWFLQILNYKKYKRNNNSYKKQNIYIVFVLIISNKSTKYVKKCKHQKENQKHLKN